MNRNIILVLLLSIWLSIDLPSTALAQDGSKASKVYIIASTQQDYNNLVKRSLRRRDKGDTATLYGDRGWGSVRTCDILVDSALVCRLNELRYLIYEVPSGTHLFSMRQPYLNLKEDNSKIMLTVEPGKTYYLLLCFDWNASQKEQYFIQLSEERANMVLPSIRQDKSCKLSITNAADNTTKL